MIRFSTISQNITGSVLQQYDDPEIDKIVTDTRRVYAASGTVFFARQGPHHDGHKYIQDLYDKGIRNFVVEKNIPLRNIPEANIFLCSSSLHTLQQLTSMKRNRFIGEVIGITGSNGKTIVKEWLIQLLSSKFRIAATPHSYNSQLGVPLSVWHLESIHDLGIFEAGISQIAEMDSLANIIQPTIGIFTNLGPAHDEGFPDRMTKIREKLKLFERVQTLIICSDHKEIYDLVYNSGLNIFSWGEHELSTMRIIGKTIGELDSTLSVTYKEEKHQIKLPVANNASIENLLHCIATMLVLNYSWEEIHDRIKLISPLKMRLELKKGIDGSYIIDDSYNNDLAGLKNALDFLEQQRPNISKVVILSDIFQSGMLGERLYESVNNLLADHSISQLIAVGPQMVANRNAFTIPAQFYDSTQSLITHLPHLNFLNKIILVKGARAFAFEKIVNKLQEKIHGTRLEINLNAITHNLNFYRSRLHKSTKVMVMVKAFAYGTGIIEIANLLQYHKVDYFGVAYTDEGVNLRENGIDIPIMVMNPSPDGFAQLLEYNLEPVIYSFDLLKNIAGYVKRKKLKVHIKVDTGMHRLGFNEEDIPGIVKLFQENLQLDIASIFSHLAAADEIEHEDFTHHQADLFKQVTQNIKKSLKINPLCHLVNSSGIMKYSNYQFDMVRLGIGLYGIDPAGISQGQLQPISSLKTIISQIRDVKPGETIGYGRKGVAEKPLRIATIAIGYADGFSRFFSNGKGVVMINDHLAPVIGNVCMDMTMVDITGIDAREGDDVVIFGENPTISDLASRIGTIPYEILTNVSERVKRVYQHD